MELKRIDIKKPTNAEIELPGSKSYANRVLIISALAKGSTLLENVPSCDDTKYMLEAVQKMGVGVEWLSSSSVKITPPGKLQYSGEIYIGAAGTTMRFLTTLCCLGVGQITLTGNARMCERPIEDLVKALEENIDGTISAGNKTTSGERCPPLYINSKGLKGGTMQIKGTTSSQYLTSILLSAPYFENDLHINIIGELTSKSYADLTVELMREFGVQAENSQYKEFIVKKGQYAGKKYRIESDSSGATYFLALAAITGGKIKILNINPNSPEGDIKFIDILEKMGCTIQKGPDYLLLKGPRKLKGITVDMNSLPDSAQTLAILAAVADGTTTITGIGNLRVKETDRIAALKSELERCGIRSNAGPDFIQIQGGTPRGAQINTYDDHRMAMSFAVLGAKVDGIVIENPGCVSKSLPEFFDIFSKL